MTEPGSSSKSDREASIGVAQAIGAYLWWGFVTGFYFKALDTVSSFELLAWRVLAGLPVMLVLIALPPGFRRLKPALADPGKVGIQVISTLLIAANWLVFIYAVVGNRLVEASLGYYINPLVSVLLGRIFLQERLRPLQKIAVLLASIGVAIFAWSKIDDLTAGMLSTSARDFDWLRLPWISLALPLSFGCYGLLRKRMTADSTTGLTIEMLFLFPFMVALQIWLMSSDRSSFMQGDVRIDALLIAGGLVTALPLILFAAAARRLRLATLGLLQYLAPTCQLLLAVLWFGEMIEPLGVAAFVLIWIAVGLYCFDLLRENRNQRAA
ncbi:MAG: protein RarD [Phycisphaerae bacterium]|nr:protein RarD [Phycisphaerae bacterium]